MNVLEVNDNDIYGKIFNGYLIMDELNKKENFSVNQLVICKFSDNDNCIRMFPSNDLIDADFYLHTLEHDIMGTHSLLSLSTLMLKNNSFYKKCDLVHFHQVHNCRFCLPTFFETAKTKPTVISLHDPWFLTGRCVHPFDCKKWENGCNSCSNLKSIFELPYDNCSELWNIKSGIADTDVDLIVHSKWMYDLVKKNPYTKKLRVHEVPLGIDISKYDFKLSKEEAKKKLNIFPNDTVIFFREQSELKGTNYIVDALKMLKDKSNITLLTCSQTGLLKEIEDDFNVVELGILEEKDMLLCYNAADIFLMPSLGESFGMMAVEAMAAGVPTIVFDNSSLSDTTGGPDIGILVKNRDSLDLYDKINFYINNVSEREKRGKLSRQFVSKKYNYNSYLKNMEKVYSVAYEKQEYKLSNKYFEKKSVDYNNENVKKLLYRLNKIYDKISIKYFGGSKGPKFLDGEAIDDENIKYSDINVINLIEKFNDYLYSKFIKTKFKCISNLELGCCDNLVKPQLPKVSIIIPVYNGGKYVSLAIDSALRQTYENIEIIVVNDGSTDNTEEVCKSYGDKIRYISKKNGGVSTALNVGIQNMTGDYFSWLSHDDLYYPEKVEVEVSYMINNNLIGTNTILYSNFSIMDGDGKLVYDSNFESEDLNRDSAFSVLKGGINGLSLLIPKKAFYDVGFFDENLRCVQDYKLWFDMYRYGYNFVHIPNVLVATRVHSESVTNTSPKVVTEGNAFWLDVIKSFSDSEKKKLYGSVYNYYYDLFNFFNYGPYNEVIAYCQKKFKNIEKTNTSVIENIKVSIIIPFFNDISSVVRAFNSVLNQTHNNIEIILINNGCCVETDEIFDLVDKNSDRVNYIVFDKNRPLADAWSEGIRVSTGDYLVFFDQYSVMDINRIKVQLLKMVCSGDIISHTSYYQNVDNKVSYINSAFQNGYVFNSLLNDCMINMSTVMILKSYLLNNNIYIHENAEDICLYFDVLKDNRLLGIMEPLVIDYSSHKKVDDDVRTSSIISYVFANGNLLKNNKEIIKLLHSYISKNDDDCSEQIHSDHVRVLERYQFIKTNEFRRVNKIRNLYHKLFFKKPTPIYMMDDYSLRNNRLNRIYKKICDIKYALRKK